MPRAFRAKLDTQPFGEEVENVLRRHGLIAIRMKDRLSFQRDGLPATVADRAKSGGYRAVVLGFSTQGRDLGPRLAARLPVIAFDSGGKWRATYSLPTASRQSGSTGARGGVDEAGNRMT